MTRARFLSIAWPIGAVVVAFIITSAMMLAVDANPIETYSKLITGSLGTASKAADVAVVWVSLALISAGLLFTFTAGQWNIGVEGQVTMGAVFATGAARMLWEAPGLAAWPIIVVWAAVGGALWAVVAGVLKTYGKVHEIFAGLGLNFIATALNIYLIFGPWRQASGGTLSGTEQFPPELWLPTLEGLRISPAAVVTALVVLVVVFLALRGTVWGLQLKAVGKSLAGANLLGIPTERRLLGAYALCGACAGMAGAFLVVMVHHRLIPSISSGYGFLSILIVLLTGFQALLVIPVALFFAAVSIGSTALQLDLKLDSSLGGVLQATIVICFLFVQGIREKWFSRPARTT